MVGKEEDAPIADLPALTPEPGRQRPRRIAGVTRGRHRGLLQFTVPSAAAARARSPSIRVRGAVARRIAGGHRAGNGAEQQSQISAATQGRFPDPERSMLLEPGPLIITFYRGIWCPYCPQRSDGAYECHVPVVPEATAKEQAALAHG